MTTKQQIHTFYALCMFLVASLWIVSLAPPLGIDGEVTTLRILNYASRWQTLIASTVALIGAATVYNGAKLNYKAAMSKVDLDHKIHQETQRRKDLGVCLRLEFSINHLSSEAGIFAAKIPAGISRRMHIFQPIHLLLDEPDGLIEAWANLDIFPIPISRTISEIRWHLYDISSHQKSIGDSIITVEPNSHVPMGLSGARLAAEHVAARCAEIEPLIADFIRSMRASRFH